MRSISATLPTLTELFTVAAHTELTARVAAVVSCDEALALKDRAASDVAPHLQAVSHICNRAFPNGRSSTDAAAYAADDLPEQVEHVASSAKALGCDSLVSQVSVVLTCYQVMQHTHRLKALPNVVDDTGIPQSVRDQHLALCTVTTTLSAYIDSPDFLPEVWRPAAAWDVPNLSSSVPYLIAHDTLAAARQVRGEFSHVWATAVTDTCTALESVTPQWQVNSLDLFSKASGDIITGMMEGGSWTWPDPTALPTSNKLVTIMNQLKRLGKVGGQVVPAGLLLQGKSVALHCSDTSAAMYVFHVLFKVLPALSDPELRSTAAATLKEQVSGKCYNLPGLLRDAVARAAATGDTPTFRSI